jgi:hypothetical protein
VAKDPTRFAKSSAQLPQPTQSKNLCQVKNRQCADFYRNSTKSSIKYVAPLGNLRKKLPFPRMWGETETARNDLANLDGKLTVHKSFCSLDYGSPTTPRRSGDYGKSLTAHAGRLPIKP